MNIRQFGPQPRLSEVGLLSVVSVAPTAAAHLIMNKGLGRKIQFDDRSRLFPVRALLGSSRPLRSYTWSCPITLDQGYEGACTGFAFTHEAAARPVKVINLKYSNAMEVYRRARALDEWPGEDYDGTSVLAAVKAAVEKQWYREYRWGFSLDDVLLALSYQGPVVLGINWYEGMGQPDENGFLQVTGQLMGGHAILANGVSLRKRAVRLHNSWGAEWGMDGECWLLFDDLRRLLSEQGEACIPIGRKIPLIRKIVGFMQNQLADL